ncbi:hypothetical protein U1Q18_037995, partial [Sarracenia purpurea var. burkii]
MALRGPIFVREPNSRSSLCPSLPKSSLYLSLDSFYRLSLPALKISDSQIRVMSITQSSSLFVVVLVAHRLPSITALDSVLEEDDTDCEKGESEDYEESENLNLAVPFQNSV